MKRFLVVVGILFSGCQREKAPEVSVNNTATRYTAGLVTSTQKAQINANEANRAIAETQNVVDKMMEEAQ